MKINLKKIVSVLVLLTIISCATKKTDEEYYAEILVDYVNYFSNILDRDIAFFQRKLNLNANQTQILYMMKRDLLSKIPDLRQVIFNFQMKLVEALEKDTAEYDDVKVVFDQLNLYSPIIRETVMMRFIELHSTMSTQQKEKLAKYIKSGSTRLYVIKTPPYALFERKFFEFNRQLDLTVKQMVILLGYNKDVKKAYRANKKNINKEGRLLQVFASNLIVADSIDIETVDKRMNESLALFDGIIDVSTKRTLLFFNSLSREQKKATIAFITAFNFI
ncbi:MAG: hypothetical protein A2015_09445 [Spirochaetes bacterium GWF1_31_7]|nr:MAG: hypothetical protein A2Y30_01135 [Spirochaetes bacterium GWE1_32_154]OHD45078.1 MAG: hypothetical protein A2Y29_15180 [Spirochaetes bacterium GWE2_31_10]OHD52645.1 MAG: hypothetical protein A2015_09445 [Spirochaetes bacterium GWF1_31_7]HBD95250.1 hypothetical protein [Spirochaetia bacterium]HBI36833.1 hypothetical protein [Spirochaetia bacterium]